MSLTWDEYRRIPCDARPRLSRADQLRFLEHLLWGFKTRAPFLDSEPVRLEETDHHSVLAVGLLTPCLRLDATMPRAFCDVFMFRLHIIPRQRWHPDGNTFNVDMVFTMSDDFRTHAWRNSVYCLLGRYRVPRESWQPPWYIDG